MKRTSSGVSRKMCKRMPCNSRQVFSNIVHGNHFRMIYRSGYLIPYKLKVMLAIGSCHLITYTTRNTVFSLLPKQRVNIYQLPTNSLFGLDWACEALHTLSVIINGTEVDHYILNFKKRLKNLKKTCWLHGNAESYLSKGKLR